MIDLIRNILSVLLIWGILLFISFILSFTSIDYQGVSLVYIIPIIVVLIQMLETSQNLVNFLKTTVIGMENNSLILLLLKKLQLRGLKKVLIMVMAFG